jgi:hypothetical protein
MSFFNGISRKSFYLKYILKLIVFSGIILDDMKQITDNENQNFEILSEEISEFPELEVLNSNDRKIFEVFLDFWNVSVYPKFVMLAQQGPKDGSARAVELVRRTKSVIGLYNQKVKNFQLYSQADAPLEYQRRFNEVFSYFENFADKKKKLNRSELDIFEEKINEYYDIINPPKKMSRASSNSYETPAAEAARTAPIDSRAQQKPYKPSEKQRDEQAGQAYNRPSGAVPPRQQPQQTQPPPPPSNRMPYQEPNYFQGDIGGRGGLKKPSSFNLAIPFGLFCFFAGAGIAGPFGAAIGLALGLLAASIGETGPRPPRHEQPPSDDVLNELKNAESVRGDSREAQTRAPFRIADPAVPDDLAGGGRLKYEAPKTPGCGLGCFVMLVCMMMGVSISGVSGVAAGLFVGFFLSSIITDVLSNSHQDIEGGFLFNGFLIGMVFGVYFNQIVLGIIIGLIAAKIAASVIIKK